MGQDLLFWAVAAAIVLAVAGIMARAVTSRGPTQEHDGALSDMAVYKDQLAEVDRDLARGVLSEAEAEAVRTEVARRLLDADKRSQSDSPVQSGHGKPLGLALILGLVVAGSTALYVWIGVPGYGDVPLAERISMADAARENRPSQATAEAEVGQPPTGGAEAEFEALLARLRIAVESRPNDLQGARLLAQHEARQGRFIAAKEAQANVVRILEQDADLIEFVRLADLHVLAAGGYVSPEAEDVLDRIFTIDPNNGAARYYAGLLFAQTGRPDLAFGIWRGLLEEGPDTAPWIAPIRAQIFDLADAAGVRYTPPPPRPGPTDEDVAAAENLTPEERAAMIEGMVEGLSDRLATEGGPAEDWVRLIRALTVLGQTDRAEAILSEAREVFTGDERSLELLRRAGLEAADE